MRKKQIQNKSENKRKTKGDKKPNKKRKDNKTLSQKSEKGAHIFFDKRQ
jgi:hypothetical protein